MNSTAFLLPLISLSDVSGANLSMWHAEYTEVLNIIISCESVVVSLEFTANGR